MAKLEIIIELVSKCNINHVLLELKQYATEIDVDFVRKSVSAIGWCVVKLEQEIVVIIKDVFCHYPN
eukprot:9272322-Ditylum_brightwellii.AAC.1